MLQVHKGKGWDFIFSQEITRVDEEAGANAFAVENMIVPVTDQMVFA